MQLHHASIFWLLWQLGESSSYSNYPWSRASDLLQDSPEADEEVKTFKIGAFFNEEDSPNEIALKLAVERFNKRQKEDGLIRVASHIEFMLKSPYLATGRVCSVLQEGVAAIFGPETPETASHVQSVCDAFEIPHIEIKWDHVFRRDNYLFNLAPHPETLAMAYSDLVMDLKWDTFLIIYETDLGFLNTEEILKLSAHKSMGVEKLPADDNYRPLLSRIFDGGKFHNFVVDCSPSTAYEILKQAQQVGLVNPLTSFIFTTLDLGVVNLNDFKYARSSIYAFRIIDPSSEGFREIVELWDETHKQSDDDEVAKEPSQDREYPGSSDVGTPIQLRFNSSGNARILKPGGGGYRNPGGAHSIYSRRFRRETDEESADGEFPDWLTTEVALIFDAIELFGHCLGLLDSIQGVEAVPLNCEASNSWEQGYSLINFMKNTPFSGITGPIQFNTTGFRSDVSLQIVSLTKQGLQRAASWDTKRAYKILWEKGFDPSQSADLDAGVAEEGNPVRGQTLVMTTIMSSPMMMWKISELPLEGNERYEGFAIDLVLALSEMLGFKFIIKPVNDKKYGSQNAKGEWNGMIREVMDEVAHFAVADLTVNKQRQGAVDFTMPFMSLGISILFVAPKAKPPSLLSFMAPMGVEVWLCVVLAIIGTSVSLFICARLTPYEWIVPHPCIDDPDELENEFTLRECFFFTIGTYLCQGAAIAPKTASTRMVAGFWYLFTLIMVSSYTANLATFLIVQDLDISIKSVNDLPKQDTVKYGCLGSGTTKTFFQTSPFEVHQQVYKNMVEMDKTDKVFMPNNKAGVEKVVRDAGRYAFFMESTVIEYNVERNCKLSQVNGLLDNKGYAIALKKGSNMTQAFSSGILKLQERGTLDQIRRKWWKEERKENACDGQEEEGEGSVKPLKLTNVGGIFLVTIAGCIVAIFVSCFELICSARDISSETKNSMCTEMINELRFAFSCKGNVREVRKCSEEEENDSSNKHGSNSSLAKNSSRSESTPSKNEQDTLVTGKIQVDYKGKE